MKNKNNQQSLEEFTALRLSLASPEEIVEWSHGEVLKPETINYRTFRTEKDGLFDERIFGPTKDFECYCGKYKRIRYRGVICDKCGVEVTYSRVRRERMGHIRLASPCAHVWFFRGIPSQMGTLLDISPREIDSVVYFSSHLVVAIDPDKKTEVLSELAKEHEKELSRLRGEVGRKIEKIEEEARLKAKGKKELSAEAIKLSARRQGAQAREQLVKEIDILSQEYQLLEGQLKGVDKLAVVSDRLYEEHYREIDRFARVQMGAEALKSVLEKLDLPSLSGEIKSQLAETSGQKRIKLVKRLRLVEGLLNSGVKPGWMVLTVLPIIPPDLRPLVQLEGGRFAASDLNDLYRRVINRNNRLARLLDLGAPEVIVRNEKRMLQEAVDSLIDVGRRTRPMRGRQELRSLSDMLKGKQGRFRQNLLGKRVDYSGRSVIIPGPRLNLDQCGLPREMALELFKPFILHEILKEGLAPNIKSARFLLEQQTGEVWDILERLVKDRPVLLNRAPTLHRLGIQAFYPQLINGKAIQLHPCVCPGFNADFDGDQMAVHVPLASQPRREAHDIMLSAKNLLRPSDGVPITVPNKEMVIGTYYLTSMRGARERKTIFASETEALYAYQQKYVGLRGPVSIKLGGKILQTTVGRVIFNSILPSSLRFFNDETNRENGAVRRLIERCLTLEGEKRTAQLIDDIKSLGFSFATQGGISIGIFDGEVVKEKQAIVEEANQKVAGIDTSFRRGLITRQEKLRLTEQIWVDATQRLDELTWENLGEDNPIKLMVTSGARGTRDQVKQIAGIRGLIVDPSGGLVELPIRSNYREGLSGFEYFSGARGARKGLVDTALKTADAGYLTRRLVDAAQDVVVREEDCGTREGLELMHGEGTLLSSFAERLVGRLAALDVRSGRKTLVKAGELIDKQKAAEIGEVGVERVTIRSPITCETRRGICIKCYGIDPATQKEVLVGTPVGIMAAQSIGEPGTQLTLRTRHVGGIVTAKDVTQGLPRVEEIFEARTPKELALMSPIAGRVEVVERDETRFLRIKPTQASQEEVEFEVDPVAELKVADNDLVGPGTTLTDGFLDLTELMEGLGQAAAQKYVLNGIQNVYSSQGVTLSDKHIEVIVRQMFSKVRVVNSGGTPLLPGEIVSGHVVEETNKRAEEEGKPPATFKPIILGVTKAALETESFLAAASFINTTRVLTEAAVSGKIDRLLGLKENVIIGRLIPVGERVKV